MGRSISTAGAFGASAIFSWATLGAAHAQHSPLAEDVCQYTRDPAVAEQIAAACTSLLEMPGQSSDQMVSAYFFRGAARYALADYTAAAADFDKASEMRPENVSLQNHRCWTRVIGGFDTGVAMRACDAAMGLAMRESRLSDILDTRGLLFLRQQQFEDAWRDYNFAVFIVPDNAHYLYGRGVAAYQLGRKTEGVDDITRAEVIDPSIRLTYEGYGIPSPLPNFGIAKGD
jgi:tetratricopeptide (TPR) repeat protein